MESQAKWNDEEEENDEEMWESDQDVREHDDVDAKLGELLDEQHQVDPGQEQGHCADLPLPVLGEGKHISFEQTKNKYPLNKPNKIYFYSDIRNFVH